MPKKGPLGGLGMYGIASSQVQTPGYAGLLDPMTGEPMEGGGGGGGFSMGFGSGGQAPWERSYTGDIGADTTNLPPSMRGLYENSAPSFESIDGAYNANLKNGMKHEDIMTLFNNQADNDKKFWADGFAKDPDFSNNLQRQSQAMMRSNSSQAAARLAFDRATKKNTQGQTINDQLKASRGVFNQTPSKPGGWSLGGTITAPLAKVAKSVSPGNGNSRRVSDPNTAAIAAMRQSRQNKSAIAKAPKASKGFTRQSAQYSNFGRGR